MAQAIIFTNSNGGVSVCIPTGEIPIRDVLAKDTPDGSIIIDTSALPADTDFFDAWELVDGVVTVSLTKAKEITRKRLQAERAPLFATQDVAFHRAQEENADTSAIIAEKKRLRAVTSLVDTVTTLDELRALKAGV